MSIFRILGLDHVVLRVADKERALAFYVGALGMNVERELASIGLTQLRAGAALLDLVPREDGPDGQPNMDHFALEITPYDEAALRRHLAAHGVEALDSGQRYGAGGTGPSLYLRDPDGNKLELKGPASGRTLPFAIVDVFAPAPLTGNPLAVVGDAEALGEDEMRRIAGEFNQAETTFILPPEQGSTRRLRSFTASGVEVTGAGHNAMGAWLWLAQSGRLGPIGDGLDLTQEIGGAVLPLSIRGTAGRVQVTMVQEPARFLDQPADPVALARALGLAATDLAVAPPPRTVSTGVAHLMVGVVDATALERAVADAARLLPVLQQAGAEGCYVYALRPPGSGILADARFFNPTVGLWEDAATGTAAGPLAAYLVETGHAQADEELVIEQGRKLGRPSLLMLRVEAGIPRLSGAGPIVAEGQLRLAED